MKKLTVEIKIEEAEALVVEVLRDSIKTCLELSSRIEDEGYAREYLKAGNFVLDHFGAKPVRGKKCA